MQHAVINQSWFRPFKKPSATRLRLFCFPYGGSGPAVFRNWPGHMPQEVEVIGILYPGREARISEPLIPNIKQMSQSLMASILPRLDKPFAFFGHSMGALIAYELASQLGAEHGQAPEHLFVSGAYAPHVSDPDPIHQLPERQFLAALVELNGMPQEVLENKELLEYALPVIRSDFFACADYRNQQGLQVRCPITAYCGDQDTRVPVADVEQWRQYTQADFDLRVLPGDHFFLHSHEQRMLAEIQQKLFPRDAVLRSANADSR